MENWQLILVILASVLVGVSIPLIIMMTIAFYRLGREIAEIGARLRRTLTKCEIISERVEIVSRGLKGGENNIADLLATAGNLAHGIDRNMRVINIFSTISTSIGMAIAAFVKKRWADIVDVPEKEEKPSQDGVSPNVAEESQ